MRYDNRDTSYCICDRMYHWLLAGRSVPVVYKFGAVVQRPVCLTSAI